MTEAIQEQETPETQQAALDDNMPPLEEVTPEAELESPEASAPSEVETPEQEEIDPVQKRINKITAEKYAEKRRADAAEQENAQLKSVQPQQSTTQTVAPKLEDFDFDEEKYNDALIDYKVEQGLAKAQTATQATAVQQDAIQVQSKFNAGVAKMLETKPDWNEAADRVPQLPKETLDMIMRSENGAEIVYHLGQNPEVANEVATANPMDAAVRVGQITALLAKPKPKEVKTSAAPEPIKPVTSGGTVGKSQEDMSMEEIYSIE